MGLMGSLALFWTESGGGSYMLCERNLERASLERLWLLRPPNMVTVREAEVHMEHGWSLDWQKRARRRLTCD